MSDNLNTMLTSPNGYNTSRLVFSKPIKTTLNSNPNAPSIETTRVLIRTVNSDGSIGELILPTDELYSYGVSENISQETGNVSGHTMPLCLWSRDRDTGKANPTESEKRWTDTFNSIVEAIKDHIIKNREMFDKYADNTEEEMKFLLKKFNPLYWKKDKGKVVEGTGPTLYPKLIETKKREQGIITKFYDYSGNLIAEPLTLVKVPCKIRAAVKIESIFIGKDCSLQVKLFEADVNVIENQTYKRLLPRPKPEGKLLPMDSREIDMTNQREGFVYVPEEMKHSVKVEHDDETSSIISDSNNVQVEKPVVKKVITRRTLNKQNP